MEEVEVNPAEGTFRDGSLPLLVRLQKLAQFLGSEQGPPEYRKEAEMLSIEAQFHITRLMREASKREHLVTTLKQTADTLRQENERLLVQARALFDENAQLRIEKKFENKLDNL